MPRRCGSRSSRKRKTSRSSWIDSSLALLRGPSEGGSEHAVKVLPNVCRFLRSPTRCVRGSDVLTKGGRGLNREHPVRSTPYSILLPQNIRFTAAGAREKNPALLPPHHL